VGEGRKREVGKKKVVVVFFNGIEGLGHKREDWLREELK
jgi:hypothetical protein